MFSADGVEELELESRLWPSERFVEWLREGFLRYERLQPTGEEYLAFRPLRFHRDGSVFGQLTAFFGIVGNRHPRLHDHARRSIEDQLRLWIGARLLTEEMQFATNLWRIYSAMGATGETIAVARLSIRELEAPPACVDRVAELVDAIALTVAAAPITGSQISFFEYLYGTDHWRDAFALLLAPRYFEWRRGRSSKAWAELLSHYGRSLRAAMDPREPAGRAFIAQLVNRLDQDRGEALDPPFDLAASHRLFTSLALDFGGDRKRGRAVDVDAGEEDAQVHMMTPAPALDRYPRWPQARLPEELPALRQMQVGP